MSKRVIISTVPASSGRIIPRMSNPKLSNPRMLIQKCLNAKMSNRVIISTVPGESTWNV